ncbi:MAG: hypothetical protein VKJ46_00310 [Leptolyngbyaceae bacterium]|nr:hypothetical protein [Leptolyngbyaceae bacterium]
MKNSRLPDDDAFKGFDRTFLLIGLGVLVVFNLIGWPFVLLASAQTLTCQREEPTQGLCTLKAKQGPLSWEKTLQDFPVNQLQGAELESSTRSTSNLYRIVIITKEKALPLTSTFASGQENKAEIVDQINAFVNNLEQSSLQVQQDDRWFFYIMGGIFIVVGNLVGVPFVWIGLSL